MSVKENFGESLSLDLYNCMSNFHRHEILSFVKDLIAKAGMKIYGDIHLELYQGRDKDTHGYSVMCFLDCSTFTMHTATNTGRVYIDLFSCKTIPVSDVVLLCKEFFGTDNFSYQVLAR